MSSVQVKFDRKLKFLTREKNYLDQVYIHIPDAYKASLLPKMQNWQG